MKIREIISAMFDRPETPYQKNLREFSFRIGIPTDRIQELALDLCKDLHEKGCQGNRVYVGKSTYERYKHPILPIDCDDEFGYALYRKKSAPPECENCKGCYNCATAEKPL